MKFDTDHAVEWAGAFGFSRAAGSEGERRAAEIVAGELARLGLRVERAGADEKRQPAAARPWIAWLVLGLLSAALEVATHRGGAWPVRLGLALLALVWLRVIVVEGFGSALVRRLRREAASVVAWREAEAGSPPAPVCVVFHTPLDSFEPARELVPAWAATPVIAGLLGAQVFFDLTIHRNPLGLPLWYLGGTCCAVLLWVAIGVRVVRLVRGPGEAGPDDNRTGVALLLELARSWPRTTSARIDARFVATGGRRLSNDGLRALVKSIVPEFRARPTLVIDWIAPGIGRGLTLAEQGTGQLAARAAADLWIPHRVAHRAAVGRTHWPLGRHGPGYVGMIGDGISARAKRAAAPEPDALGRAAQLATEVALRWARRIETPAEHAASR
jgi:hypothetical protein